MRRRTRWDLRLKIYPIIVIAAMVYLNVAPQAELTQRTASELVGATPVQGSTSDGRVFVWERNPEYPVIEFVMTLTNERR